MTNSELKTGNKSNNNGNSLFLYIVFLIIGLLLVLLLIFLIQYLRLPCGPEGKMNFIDYLLGLKLNSPCNPCELPKEEPVIETCDEEVVHVPQNIYTYPEAKHKCEISGGRLANKQDLIKAYNRGAQWNSYGWSESSSHLARKNAYQVIQPCDYIKMRKQGKNIAPPGVQGGRFLPKLRFGINCLMKKPDGEVKKRKKCCKKYPTICQRNPQACKPIGVDNMSPFNPSQWSQC